MTDKIFTIINISKLRTHNIADHLASETCSIKRKSVIDSIFKKLLSGQPPLEKQIQYAIRTIELSNGMINIKEITDKIGR